ncbi:thioredoxin domain-containing protein [Sanyastnella coralliicola]|uniref:thioredoxin domain-containing protein n=1 Tax=Sanyastnella coralliicola TaxID=3069118 RepID=UPI0027B9F901|nr:thioredoxin domain-containing protein [Longitalea sp. SCSIO 12813]
MIFRQTPFLFLIVILAACAGQKNETPMKHKHTNALVNETSPYLLQHAHNPVDWHPWGDEAFEKAKAENKLVLISVGYSACHWCHVMERETFEDSLAAAYMNEHFVNIKVDREERPDVDQVYMNAVQLMTNKGGWPLNCFALADGRPIFGGTYFPKEEWIKVLESLVDIQQNQPEKMEDYAAKLTEGVQQSELIERAPANQEFEQDSLDTIVERWKLGWDLEEGGPNRAPKFPLPNNYEFLLQYGTLTQDQETLDFVKLTLDKMAQGGIYDQVGGGFARYSVDGMWKVPHFEKMLYDNAQLVSLYSEGYRAFKISNYRTTVFQTLDFIEREMTSDEGAFYSALDADSEGEEGKFYIWSQEEAQALLGNDFELAQDYYHIGGRGNWEHGNSILLRRNHPEEYAAQKGMTIEELQSALDRIESALMSAREDRIRPGLDDKILTSWNAMMVKGYVDAYRAFGNPDHLASAERAMRFILAKCRKEDGGLWHSYKDGNAKINGYLEDYCFTLEALVALYQGSFDEQWLNEAKALADYTIAHFHDESSGMFWFTSDLDPALIARKQETSDNVIPASNSSMAKALWQLGTYYDQAEYKEHADQMLRNIMNEWSYGQSYSNWGSLMLWHTFNYKEVAITGEEANGSLRSELDQNYLPNVLLMGGTSGDLPLLEGKFIDTPTIFVCENKACKLPVNNVADALDQIRQ